MATFEMLKRPDSVIVLGVTAEDRVIIIEQEQPNHPKHWSLPTGRIDEGEDPLEAAQREMREETGFTFADWKLVQVHQPYPKIEWFVHYYVAQNPLERVEQRLDAGEKIEVHEVPYARVVEHIKSGDIQGAEPLLYAILNGKEQLADILALDFVQD